MTCEVAPMKRYMIHHGDGTSRPLGEMTEEEAIKKAKEYRQKDSGVKLREVGGGEISLKA